MESELGLPRTRNESGWNKDRTFVYEDNEEINVHMIVELPSIEPAKRYMENPEIKQKRVQAGVILDSQVVIPLAD